VDVSLERVFSSIVHKREVVKSFRDSMFLVERGVDEVMLSLIAVGVQKENLF
jgi:hypothetical protein